MAFTSNFQSNTPSQHFEAIGKQLLKNRQKGDTSKCDVRLILRNDEIELVDSFVIIGHSATLAEILINCRPPYGPIDLTSLDETAVRHVVNWMYSGFIDLPRTAIGAVLIVAAHLKVSALRRDLENYLRTQAEHDGFIFALNTATAESSNVSEGTLVNITLSLSRKLDMIFDMDIGCLTFNSIVAIMATLLPAEKKVALVNMAIRWLQIQKSDWAVKEAVVKSVAISDLNGESLFELQSGLLVQLKRRDFDVRLVNTIDGGVVIQDRSVAVNSNQRRSQPSTRSNSDYSTFSSSSASSSSSSSSYAQRQRVYPTQSQIADLQAIPDVFEGSPYQRQLENPVEQSQSLRDQRAAIPDPFSSGSTGSTSGHSRVERSNSLERARPESRFSVASSGFGFNKPGSRATFGKQRSSRRFGQTAPPPMPVNPTHNPNPFAKVRSKAMSGGIDDPLRSPDVSRPSTSRGPQENSEESNTTGSQIRSQYLYPQ